MLAVCYRLQQLLDQATQKLEEITEKQNTQQQASVDCTLHPISSYLLSLQNVVELASIVDQQKTQVQTLQERLDEFKMSNKKVVILYPCNHVHLTIELQSQELVYDTVLCMFNHLFMLISNVPWFIVCFRSLVMSFSCVLLSPEV